MKGKIAVVTAVFGGMDDISPIPPQSVEYDRFIFTEANSPFPLQGLSDRHKAGYFKLQTHQFLDHRIIIWLDGNIEVTSPDFIAYLRDQIDFYLMAIGKHPERADAYEEAAHISQQLSKGDKYHTVRYDKSAIEKEGAYYSSQGYPQGFGLWWCGIFVRWNWIRMNRFFDSWWNQSLRWANFDQNAFSFEVWKRGAGVNTIKWEPYFKNEYFTIKRHAKFQ